MASKKELRKLKKELKKKGQEPVPANDEIESSSEDIPEAVELDEDSDQDQESDQESDQEDNESNAQSGGDEEDTEVPQKKVFPNNKEALLRLADQMKLKSLPWIETMAITSSKALEPTYEEEIDMERAFLEQAMDAALQGRKKVLDAGVAFSRPNDYYAEMIKSDEHMARVRQRLSNDMARIEKSEQAKEQRRLRKFGKKIQIEKQLERQKQKSDTLDKIKLLKRKRKDGKELTGEDDFDVALEKADKSKKRAKTEEPPSKRALKDAKYGFGGKRGRHHKSNTSASSAETGNYSKMKGLSSGRARR